MRSTRPVRAVGARPASARRIAAACVLTATALAGGCGPEPDPPVTARAERDRAAVDGEIDRVYADFADAYAEANVDRLLREVYGENAFHLPPGGGILRGEEGLRRGYGERAAAVGAPGPRITFDVVDRQVSGDVAYDIGRYTIRAPGASPDAPASEGEFVVIWKRDPQGRWRIQADVYKPGE